MLGVASATLRRYSVQFSDYLSPSASAAVAQGGGALERRYTENDIALLKRASGLLERGQTFDQVRAQLADSEDAAPAAPHQLTITPDMSLAFVEAMSAQRETIAAQKQTIALLQHKVERLEAEQERQRGRYLSIIRNLLRRRAK
jgi:DNA-binding transcriptional MerR regulator